MIGIRGVLDLECDGPIADGFDRDIGRLVGDRREIERVGRPKFVMTAG